MSLRIRSISSNHFKITQQEDQIMQTVGPIKTGKLKRKLETKERNLCSQTEFFLHLHQQLNVVLSVIGVGFIVSFLL